MIIYTGWSGKTAMKVTSEQRTVVGKAEDGPRAWELAATWET